MNRPTILDRDDVAVVPVELTGSMIKAALDTCPVAPSGMNDEEADYFCNSAEYSAMLSASPHSSAWQEVQEYVAGLEMERNAFRGVLEGEEYGYIEDIAKYDAEKAKALGRVVGKLSKALLTRTETAEARIEPFAAVEPMNVWHETEENDGYHSLTENQFRSARAWKEGK